MYFLLIKIKYMLYLSYFDFPEKLGMDNVKSVLLLCYYIIVYTAHCKLDLILYFVVINYR